MVFGGGWLACVAGWLVNYVNVIPGRAAHPGELRSPEHIVKAINYNMIIQQRYFI